MPFHSIGTQRPNGSVASNQAIGFFRGEVTSRVSVYLVLEAADCGAGQPSENTIHRTLIIIQAAQRFLDLPSVCFRHLVLCGQARRG